MNLLMIPYRFLVWLWAWVREFMIVGSGIIGAAAYPEAPAAAAMLCIIVWAIANIVVGIYGEDMRSNVLRDFMIRHKAVAFALTSDGHSSIERDSFYDDDRKIQYEDHGVWYNRRNRPL